MISSILHGNKVQRHKPLDSTGSSKAPTHITSTTFGKIIDPYFTHSNPIDILLASRWKPFDPQRNWPDLGARFINGEMAARAAAAAAAAAEAAASASSSSEQQQQRQQHRQHLEETVADDKRDLDWATVLKRTFEAYVRGETPNMYGEWLQW